MKKPRRISSMGTVLTFLRVGTWSETVLRVVDRSFDQPLPLEERASMPLAGGIVQHGYQCGQVWGAAFAAGARAYQLFGAGPQAEAAAIVASQRLVHAFRERYGCVDCFELTTADWKIPSTIVRYFFTGGAIRCFGMTAGYVPIVFDEIDAALSGQPVVAPPPPVSCAALLAQKAGASDLHTVMAAGLAGGIGLSGGACGALGAAVWLVEVSGGEHDVKQIQYNSPRAARVIDRFVESTGGRFECSQIVGRRFSSVADHAHYIREGGCADIVEALAATCRSATGL